MIREGDSRRGAVSAAPAPMIADGRTRVLGIAGIVGVLAFWSTVSVLHVVQSDLSPVNDFVSDYANGASGWLFPVGVIVHGVGNLAIAGGVARELRRTPSSRLGLGMFTVAALGLITAGIYRTDPPGVTQTTAGVVHGMATNISFGVELVALLLLASVFRTDPRWQDYTRSSVAMTLVAAALSLWLVVALRMESAVGLAERAALASFTVWEFATAVRLIRRGNPRAGLLGTVTPRVPWG